MDALLADAIALLAANTQEHERDGRRYRFSAPSQGHYPFQWLWDSCFHAIVWARVDPERAADELRSLLAWQYADGFVPHVVFWRQDRVRRLTWHHLESRGGLTDWLLNRPPQTSALTQPPVLAQALAAVAARHPAGDALVAELLPRVAAFYRYLAVEREREEGLIASLCQFETGLDYSPAYDGAIGMHHENPASLFLRSRRIQLKHKRFGFDLARIFADGDYAIDPLMNAAYGQGLRTLAELAKRDGDAGLEQWAASRAASVSSALLEHCYDEGLGLFIVRYGNKRVPQRVRTVQGLMPLLVDGLPADVVESLVKQLEDPRQFGSPYPVSSVALSEPSFGRSNRVWGQRFIWRGPCSMNVNWLLADALRRRGADDLAERIAAPSREMARQGGFSEFYDPVDGRALGVHRFGWATLAAII